MSQVLDIIKNGVLTYEQKVVALAKAAENSIEVLDVSNEAKKLMGEGIICTLHEGNAPYRPRYVVPDYELFMKNGSEFLRIKPPTNIWEATNSLMILYKHVPSITSFPVYLGNIDRLLQPFVEDENEAYLAIKLFLDHIDRTLTDSFCHANIGPEDSKAARLILKADKELNNSVPNITLKYADNTPDELAYAAIDAALVNAKPSFANHEMFENEFGKNYGIASCYNGLYIGGGSHTLVRLNLANLAKKAKDEQDFLNKILPNAVKTMAGYMDSRVDFLVNESRFFSNSFLVKEGLINIDRFTAMFGMFGLAECINYLMAKKGLTDRYGHSKDSDRLGIQIIERLSFEVGRHSAPYCKATDDKYILHAQVGLDTDYDISPGCRIPIGEEPCLLEHLMHCTKFHKYFPSGIGDIFNFDITAKQNPKYILDIIKGSFKKGIRYFSLYSTESDVIRITGYLVKRSDMEKLDRGEQTLNGAVVLGLGATKNSKILERKIRKNV